MNVLKMRKEELGFIILLVVSGIVKVLIGALTPFTVSYFSVWGVIIFAILVYVIIYEHYIKKEKVDNIENS